MGDEIITGDGEPPLGGAEVDILACDLGHQAEHDVAPVFHGELLARLRRVGRVPTAAEDVDFPGGVKAELVKVELAERATGNDGGARRPERVRPAAADVDRWCRGRGAGAAECRSDAVLARADVVLFGGRLGLPLRASLAVSLGSFGRALRFRYVPRLIARRRRGGVLEAWGVVSFDLIHSGTDPSCLFLFRVRNIRA